MKKSIMEAVLMESRVIVRVWTSIGAGGVGHVSIETHYGYMSLWPARPVLATVKDMLGMLPPDYKPNYEADLKSMEVSPDLMVSFYSLNAEKMLEEFNNLKKITEGWALLGSNIFFKTSGKESCSSLAYKILRAGGIYELISSGHSSKHSSIISPDNLYDSVIAAKRFELKNHPETASSALRVEGETKVPEEETSKTFCSVM